jgi:hypothetical protein
MTDRTPRDANRHSLATKHLCAGAYLDRGFRNRVIDEVYHHPENAVAPNPGSDAEPVLGHMLRARKLDIAQQGFLAALLLLALIIPMVDKLVFFIGLAVWLALGLVLVALETTLRATPAQRRNLVGSLFSSRNAMTLIIVGVAVTAAIAYLSNLPDASSSSDDDTDSYEPDYGYETEDSYGSEDDYDYETEDDYYYETEDEYGYDTEDEYDYETEDSYVYESEDDYSEEDAAILAVLWLLMVGGCAIGFSTARVRGLRAIAEGTEPDSDGRAQAIGSAQRSTVVTYAASRLPFVGSGQNITTWQFALAVRPREEGGPDPEIDPVDLNRHIKIRVAALGEASKGTMRLPGLNLSDRVYVSGRDVDAPVLKPSKLREAGYEFNDIAGIQRDPTTPVRHYLRCELVSWGGELVTTIYCHFALQGESLYVEFSSHLLSPTPDRFHVFERDGGLLDHTEFWEGVRSSAMMPIDLVRSPFDTIANALRGIRNASRKGPGGDQGALEDCGALVGVRELGIGNDRQNYFQHRDSVKYTGILERQILAALTEYLREHGVDTTELEERVTAIVNHGVINYGDMAAGAIGQGASATVGSVGGGSQGNVKGGR